MTSSPAADSPRRNASEANVNQSPHLSGRVGKPTGCSQAEPEEVSALRASPPRAAFTPGPWRVNIDGTLTGAWAEVAQECVDPDTNEPWCRELFRSETTHVRKADCYPPNGTFGDIDEAPDEWELTEDGEEHLANARLIAAAPELYRMLDELCIQLNAEDFTHARLIAREQGFPLLRKARGEVA